jgi:hypothetical protein
MIIRFTTLLSHYQFNLTMIIIYLALIIYYLKHYLYLLIIFNLIILHYFFFNFKILIRYIKSATFKIFKYSYINFFIVIIVFN